MFDARCPNDMPHAAVPTGSRSMPCTYSHKQATCQIAVTSKWRGDSSHLLVAIEVYEGSSMCHGSVPNQHSVTADLAHCGHDSA